MRRRCWIRGGSSPARKLLYSKGLSWERGLILRHQRKMADSPGILLATDGERRAAVDGEDGSPQDALERLLDEEEGTERCDDEGCATVGLKRGGDDKEKLHSGSTVLRGVFGGPGIDGEASSMMRSGTDS